MAYQVGFYFNNLLHVQSRHPPNKGRAICFVSWMWAVTAGNELVRLAHCQQNVHNTSTSRTWATHWQYVGYYLGVLGLTEYFREKKKHWAGNSFQPMHQWFLFQTRGYSMMQTCAILWDSGLVSSLFNDHIQSRLQQRLARGYIQTVSCQPEILGLFWFSLSLESRIKLIAVLLGGA